MLVNRDCLCWFDETLFASFVCTICMQSCSHYVFARLAWWKWNLLIIGWVILFVNGFTFQTVKVWVIEIISLNLRNSQKNHFSKAFSLFICNLWFAKQVFIKLQYFFLQLTQQIMLSFCRCKNIMINYIAINFAVVHELFYKSCFSSSYMHINFFSNTSKIQALEIVQELVIKLFIV